MAGSLQVSVRRLTGRGSENLPPVYGLELVNPMCLNGRALNNQHVLSFEDLRAMHSAIGKVLLRVADQVTEKADVPGTTDVKAIDGEIA